jgi:hypothetical protein
MYRVAEVLKFSAKVARTYKGYFKGMLGLGYLYITSFFQKQHVLAYNTVGKYRYY